MMITVGILLVVIVVIFIVYLGRAKRQPKPYVDALVKTALEEEKTGQPYLDAGVSLIFKLTTSLNLPGGLPSYTPAELKAINRRMSSFQKTANDVAGGEVKFHPEFVPDLQRTLVAEALIKLAGDTRRFSDEVPADWRKRVATYLKGWAANFDPQALTELGDLLAEAGHRSEAKETFRVLLLFPTYSETYFAGRHDHDQELVDSIVSDAKESIQKLD